MIPKSICSVTDFQCFIVFLFSQEISLLTTIQPWSQNSGGVFPLGLSPSGLSCLNFGYVCLHHRRGNDSDVNSFKLRKGFQTQIWDPGVSIYRFAKSGIRLWMDHTNGRRFMFLLTIEIQVLHLTKTSLISCFCGDIFLFSLFVSVALRETLMGFKTKINLGLVDESATLPQSSDELVSRIETSSMSQGRRIFVEYYLADLFIGVLEKAILAIEDTIYTSVFYHVVEVHDLVAKNLPYKKATFAKGSSISSYIIVDLWSRESLGINKRKKQEDNIEEMLLRPLFAIEDGKNFCLILDLLSNTDWLYWKPSLWQQLWERKKRRYPNEHRESLRELPSTLIPVRRQVPESFPMTFIFIPLKKVMPRAFWSLSYKLLANKKCVKEGHNRLYLLAYKSKDSMVTLHSFIEIVIISCICVNGRFEMLMYLVNTF